MSVLFALLAFGCGSESSPDETAPPPGFEITTDDFEVPQGTEVQRCYFFEVPGDDALFVNRIQFSQNEGSHHMNVFRVNTVVNLDGAPGDVVVDGECWKSTNWADWALVANSQRPGDVDWQMPDGVALRFEPGEKLMLQTHYVNATTQQTPSGGSVTIQFSAIESSKVAHELGTLFATNQNIRVCPGDVARRYEATCKIGQGGPVTVLAASGHFHSRGDRFTISTFDQFSGAGELFYESQSWNDPPFTRELSVQIPDQGGVTWGCEFSAAATECGDPGDSCCFTFGGKVEYQEHCNAFVYYYPRGSTDVNCF